MNKNPTAQKEFKALDHCTLHDDGCYCAALLAELASLIASAVQLHTRTFLNY